MKEVVFGSPAQVVLSNFSAAKLTVAREYRGFTKRELAEKIGKTASAVSQFESSRLKPDIETFARIVLALGLSTDFFAQDKQPPEEIQIECCHFRALRRTSQQQRKQVVRSGEIYLRLVGYLESLGIDFPEEKIRDFSTHVSTSDDIERLAIHVRQSWNLGQGPLPNLVRLLESKGIIVLPIYESCEEVDAFSVWLPKRPLIFLSLGKTASRARFDAAHELGHLLMHEDAIPGDSVLEHQANRFASAFLLPRETFSKECPKRWSFSAFNQLKPRWKVSVQAMVKRAADLGIFSASTMSRAFAEMGQRGLRMNEGQEWKIEEPTAINEALQLLRDEISIYSISQELSLPPAELIRTLNRCVDPILLDKLQANYTPAEIGAIVSLRS